MEGRNKENRMTTAIYAQLKEDQVELKSYLNYIRHRPKANKIIIQVPKHFASQQKFPLRQKRNIMQVKGYLEEYLKLIKEVGNLENDAGRKIIAKLIQYLEEFPNLRFLVQKGKGVGKYQKKLCLNKSQLMSEVNDDMIPLLQKIIQKIQLLKKQADSKKLMQLGQRITHLQNLVESVPKPNVCFPMNPFRMLDHARIEKYLMIEENMTRAQKNYGRFSEKFHKNHEVFSTINRVYQQISQSNQQVCF